MTVILHSYDLSIILLLYYAESASATCTVGVSTSRVIIAIVLTFIMWPVLYILWKLIFCYFKRKRLSTVMIRHRGKIIAWSPEPFFQLVNTVLHAEARKRGSGDEANSLISSAAWIINIFNDFRSIEDIGGTPFIA